MYPNIITRLTDAVADLEQWIVKHDLNQFKSEKGNEPIIVDSEEKANATEVIQAAKDFLNSVNPT
jgi:hypothetical protein